MLSKNLIHCAINQKKKIKKNKMTKNLIMLSKILIHCAMNQKKKKMQQNSTTISDFRSPTTIEHEQRSWAIDDEYDNFYSWTKTELRRRGRRWRWWSTKTRTAMTATISNINRELFLGGFFHRLYCLGKPEYLVYKDILGVL